MQAGLTNISDQQQLTLGIRPDPYTNYIARGSSYAASTLSSTIGQLMQYTTVIQVTSANYQVKFVVAVNSPLKVLANESGSTGSGNVTNISIRKI